MEIEGKNILSVWEESLKKVMDSNLDVPTQRRDGFTRERLNLQLLISSPLDDLDEVARLDKKRGIDYNTFLHEIYWNHIIEDKLTRFTSEKGEIDQLEKICNRLQVHYNRQAYATIWSPVEDAEGSHPVCILGVYFYIRQECLNMVAVLRSNDAWGQALNDIYHLVEIQKKVAAKIDREVGTYTHYVMSYHIYDEDFKNVQEYLSKKSNTST